MVKINVRDFMTEAQKADVDSGRASLDVTDAFQKAVDTAACINSLQTALREALDGWEEWLGSKEDADRVEYLRKQYLDT